MLELAKRDNKHEHNWNVNPITAKCVQVYNNKIKGFNAKRTIQGALMLHMLRINNATAWELTSKRLLYLLHKYRARDYALMLHIFDTIQELELGDVDDVISVEAYTQRDQQSLSEVLPTNFFERLVAMLPMMVPQMTNRDLVRTLEILVARNLGGQRLFDHYIYMKIERNVLKFDTSQYCRTVRALADKGFVEDSVFWDDYVFKYATSDKNGREGQRVFTFNQAKQAWDSLVYLKLRCPTIDLKDTLKHIEVFLDQKDSKPAS